MKTVWIRELDGIEVPKNEFALDLNAREVHDCIGCWCCWQKTPGRCAFYDLDDFYAAFLAANRAVFFTGVSHDFVSGRLKTLFDRMIPHYLPFTEYSTGESMHLARYDHYPEVEVRYQGKFTDEAAQQLYEEYLHRVFYQFHIPNITIRPMGSDEGWVAM